MTPCPLGGSRDSNPSGSPPLLHETSSLEKGMASLVALSLQAHARSSQTQGPRPALSPSLLSLIVVSSTLL